MALRISTTLPTTPIDEVVENPQKDLLNALSALHFGGKYSDLRIRCNYREWFVHRAIVCSRSGFFDGACSGQFAEALSGVIDLSEDDEEAVEQMIHFFYHLDYLTPQTVQPVTTFRHRARSDARRRLPKKLDLSHIEDPLLSLANSCSPEEPSPISPVDSINGFDSPDGKPKLDRTISNTPSLEPDLDSDAESIDELNETAQEAESHLLLHTRVYALAEKYDIPTLKQLAKRKFEMEMACFYDSPEFAEAIEDVYCSTIDTDRGLRDVVLEAFKNYPKLASTQDVYTVIHSTPSLQRELWKLEMGLPV